MRLRVDQPFGHVSVKLCNVLPDGSVALITRGMLDLRHRGVWPQDPHGAVGAAPEDLVPGEWIDVALEFEATTWALLPGNTLRLAIAGTDWPNCWPPPGPVTLDVDTGSIELVLPHVALPDSTHGFAPGAGPSPDDADGVTWRFEHDVLTGETRAITRYGGTYDGAHGATITDDYAGTVGVSVDDPSRAWVSGHSSFEITWDEVTARAESVLSVRSDATSFEVELELLVWENGVELAHRTWQRTLHRR
jgi:hypothetical protein